MATTDYYADASAPGPAMPEKEKEPQEGESNRETTIIPKSILGGKECAPGEKLEFEVTDVMEDSVAVKFSGYEDSESEDEDESEGGTSYESESAPPPMMTSSSSGTSAFME